MGCCIQSNIWSVIGESTKYGNVLELLASQRFTLTGKPIIKLLTWRQRIKWGCSLYWLLAYVYEQEDSCVVLKMWHWTLMTDIYFHLIICLSYYCNRTTVLPLNYLGKRVWRNSWTLPSKCWFTIDKNVLHKQLLLFVVNTQ